MVVASVELGKSTILASMLHYRNQQTSGHILPTEATDVIMIG
jgi:Tfp pilus assembly ATPase PilU